MTNKTGLQLSCFPESQAPLVAAEGVRNRTFRLVYALALRRFFPRAGPHAQSRSRRAEHRYGV
jgi:hypothetical protein